MSGRIDGRAAANTEVPPDRLPAAGGRAAPRRHIGYESAHRIPEGGVLTRWSEAVENDLVSKTGECLFMPPEAVNPGATQAPRAVVACSDAAEHEHALRWRTCAR